VSRYELFIDEHACWGCMACEAACKQEHNPSEGVKLITVTEQWSHNAEGILNFTFRVRVCRHCDDSPCIEVCPEDAIFKRDDGIVILRDEKCSGCGACIEACPYGAIVFDDDQGMARKCDLCYQRVDHGLLPACADNVCPAHCIYFGNPEEIKQRISSLGKLMN
jgi:Fe-S-cluster-containing dehydrogenase component